MARLVLTISVLLLGLAVSWAGAEAEKPKSAAESPPTVTLSTLITGTCQEVHRYAESMVGSGVIRSAVEVQRGDATSPDNLLFLSPAAPGSGFPLLFS